MAEESKKTDYKLLLAGGLGVGAITLGGYIIGFSYEKGYSDYFGIPAQLIKLNLINILLAITGLVVLLWFLSLTIFLWHGTFIRSKGIIPRTIAFSTPGFFFCFLIFFIYGNDSWPILKWAIFWPTLTLFEDFILPLITQRGKGTYYQKLEAAQKLQNFASEKFLSESLIKGKRGLIAYWLVAIAFILYFSVFAMGQEEAKRQKSFLVIKEPKSFESLVVLRIYGDRFICAPFDSKEGTVEKTFYILDDLTPKNCANCNWSTSMIEP